MTDQELENVLENIRFARNCHYHLTEVEDYIDQIALTATIVSNYEHQFPDTDGLQVRMIERMAKQGSEILRKAEEKLDDALGSINVIVMDIYLERLREQEEKAKQDSKVINLLQVTEDRVTN